MNEKQINAMMQILCNQRDANANAVVQLTGQVAILQEEIETLKKKYEPVQEGNK